MSEGVLFSRLLEVLLAVPVNTAKNYFLVSVLFVVNKVFKKLVNNRIVDHLEK